MNTKTNFYEILLSNSSIILQKMYEDRMIDIEFTLKNWNIINCSSKYSLLYESIHYPYPIDNRETLINYFSIKLNEKILEGENQYYVFDNIIKNFNCHPASNNNIIFIHLTQIEVFLDNYNEYCTPDISWGLISKDYNINNYIELIIKYNYLWKWDTDILINRIDWDEFTYINNYKCINKYGYFNYYSFKISLTRQFILNNIDDLDWDKISVHMKDIPVSLLREYRNNWNWDLLLQYSDIKWSSKLIIEFIDLISIDILCSSENIYWDLNLINIIKDEANWDLLSLNNSIPWDAKYISIHKENINFSKLSNNTGVKWSGELIMNYINEWNWGNLSSNAAVPWNFELINKFENHIFWDVNHIGNVVDLNDPKGDIDIKSLSFISENKNICWTYEMINKFKHKIDFKLIAKNGKITEDAIVSFAKYFDKLYDFEKISRRDSNGTHVAYSEITAWSYFTNNSNINLNYNILDFLYIRKVKNGWKGWGNPSKIVPVISISGIDSLGDLSEDDIAQNHDTWVKYLIDRNHISPVLWINYIKPFMRNVDLIKFLKDSMDPKYKTLY